MGLRKARHKAAHLGKVDVDHLVNEGVEHPFKDANSQTAFSYLASVESVASPGSGEITLFCAYG